MQLLPLLQPMQSRDLFIIFKYKLIGYPTIPETTIILRINHVFMSFPLIKLLPDPIFIKLIFFHTSQKCIVINLIYKLIHHQYM